jgi:hypothetical protein
MVKLHKGGKKHWKKTNSGITACRGATDANKRPRAIQPRGGIAMLHTMET